MKIIIYFFTVLFVGTSLHTSAQNVGIGTLNPVAKFHVLDSNVLFGGPFTLPSIAGNVPVSGAGIRMMWYPDKAAFRVGRVSGTQWNKDSIGVSSFAGGLNTKAKGFTSFAMGDGCNATGNYSVAMGNFTDASALGSISLGVGANADGNYSTALGGFTNAKNDYAIATGAFTNALGNASTAMGNSTIASGANSTSLGSNTVASSLNSFVLGRYNDSIIGSSKISWVDTDPLLVVGNGTNNATRNNALLLLKNGNLGLGTNTPKARLHVDDSSVVFTGPLLLPSIGGNPPIDGTGSRMMWYADKAAFRVGGTNETAWNKANTGRYSFASGYSTSAVGTYSTAMGFESDASGLVSTALGNATQAGGYFSTSMGYGTIANANSSTVLGRFNDSIIGSSKTTWVDTDPVFMIGNGSSNNARSNAITILKNAKTGINTDAPKAMLHVVKAGLSGGPYSSGAAVIIENDSTSFIQLSNPTESFNGIYSGTTATSIRSGIVFFPDSSISFRVAGNIQRMRLYQQGNLQILGVFIQNSDMRLKKNISMLSTSLPLLKKLNGYTYHWKSENCDPKLQTGLLAQEVEKVLPNLVYTTDDGIKAVNYIGLVPHLLQAIKEQQAQIDDILKELRELKKKK
jgi:Chaperone of endosialidase/Head domain of trimeric autotransporter adhesin